MPVLEVTKQERMHIRVDANVKRKLERAAAYAHKSLSEFVLGQALTSAEKIIQEHESITLTEQDWDVFMDALENPPAPNERLRKAFALHKVHVKQG